MKFKLDENLGDIGRAELTAAGHDVMSVHEQNMSGVTDQHLFDVCRMEERALVTLDHDFGEVLRFPPASSAGIVVIECRGRISVSVVRSLVSQFVTHLREQPLGRELWIVEPGRIRVRQRTRGEE